MRSDARRNVAPLRADSPAGSYAAAGDHWKQIDRRSPERPGGRARPAVRREHPPPGVAARQERPAGDPSTHRSHPLAAHRRPSDTPPATHRLLTSKSLTLHHNPPAASAAAHAPRECLPRASHVRSPCCRAHYGRMTRQVRPARPSGLRALGGESAASAGLCLTSELIR